MTYKAIPIEDYYVIVINEPCRLGDIGVMHLNEEFRSVAVQGEAADKYPGIPLFDAPWEEDVEKLAEEYFERKMKCEQGFDLKPGWRKIFIDSYNAAKAKYEFTCEDMRKSYNAGLQFAIPRMEGVVFDQFLQSLKKQKVYEVQIEEDFLVGHPKITNNKINITSWKEIN
jgi:hypothetical protein